MKIIGTGKFDLMPAGVEFNEPEDMAKHLVEMGAAVKEEDWTARVLSQNIIEVKEKAEVVPVAKKRGRPAGQTKE